MSQNHSVTRKYILQYLYLWIMMNYTFDCETKLTQKSYTFLSHIYSTHIQAHKTPVKDFFCFIFRILNIRMTNSFPRTSFFTCRKACWIRYKNEWIFPRIGRCQYLRKTQSTIYVVPMTNGQWHTKTMIARQELIWITNDSEQIESRLACHL